MRNKKGRKNGTRKKKVTKRERENGWKGNKQRGSDEGWKRKIKKSEREFSLKWQCHEIVAFFLFHESHPSGDSGPLINRLKCFSLKIRICRDIREISDSGHAYTERSQTLRGLRLYAG